MKTAFFSHPDCQRHDMGHGHPESPARAAALDRLVQGQAWAQRLDLRPAPLATAQQLERAHDRAYVAQMLQDLEQAQQSGQSRSLDPDTMATPGTLGAVLRGAGAGVAAVDHLLGAGLGEGTAADTRPTTAFCAVRPPGHHATRSRAMGFCFFNNVVVAARHALEHHGLERVAIIDFDVHHGNGTEDIVADDPRILMVSFFQYPLYPYSGVEPLGTNMVNVPLAPYSNGQAVRKLVEEQWLPALNHFQPQMLFISAGFDAHREDGLGQLGLVEADYAWLTRSLKAVAREHAQGRIVSMLEGGYNLGALARSVQAHLEELGQP